MPPLGSTARRPSATLPGSSPIPGAVPQPTLGGTVLPGSVSLPGSTSSLPGGGTLPGAVGVGTAEAPTYTPEAQQIFKSAGKLIATEDWARAEYNRLLSTGMDESVARASVYVQDIQRREAKNARGNPFLNALFKVLGTGEATVSGFLDGLMTAIDEGDGSPWMYFRAIGSGFAEIPTAVSEGYTATDYFLEHSDPGSFFYRHARPIGLVTGILWDPTTYVSFGATTATKQAVGTLLETSLRASYSEAEKIIARGVINPRTGKRFTDIDEAAAFSHITNQRPFTPGDLTRDDGYAQYLRKMSEDIEYNPDPYKVIQEMQREAKGNYRRFNPVHPLDEGGVVPGVTAATRGIRSAQRIAGGYLLPTGGLGGRGIRFAGKEIPGTAKLGEKVAVGVRGKAAQLAASEATRGISDIYQTAFAFIPGAKARHVMGDAVRAHALGSFERWRNARQAHILDTKETIATLAKTPHVEVLRPDHEVLFAMSPRGETMASRISQSAPDVFGGATYLTRNEGMLKDLFGSAKEGIKGKNVPKFSSNRTRVVMPTEFVRRLMPTDVAMPAVVRTSLQDALKAAARRADGYKNKPLAQQIRAITKAFARRENVTFEEFWSTVVSLGDENLRAEDLFTRDVREALTKNGIPGIKIRHDSTKTDFLDDKLGHDWDYVIFDEKQMKKLKSGKHPMQAAEENVIEGGSAIPPDQRKAIWDQLEINDATGNFGWKHLKDPRHQAFVRAINRSVTDLVKQGTAKGVSKSEILKQWAFAVKDNKDPLAAVAQFRMHTLAKIEKNDFLAEMLEDRIFARPIAKKGSEAGAIALEDVPPGWEPFSHLGKKYAVRGDLADAFRDFSSNVIMDKEMSRILRKLNAPQQWWKIFATSPNPSFHVMNFVGAVWNNILAGIYSPIDYVDAVATLYRARLGETALAGERRLFGVGPTPALTPAREDAMIAVDEATKRGGLGRTSFLFSETTRPQQELRDAASPQWTPKALVSPEAAGMSKKRFAATRARQGIALATAPVNPLGLALLFPEAVKVGRGVGNWVEDVARLAPFMAKANDPVIKEALHHYGPITVPNLRHSGFSKSNQAAMYDLGAKLATKYQFDYTDLTHFERNVAKTIFPFYTYFRKNFMLQLTENLKQPRNIMAAEQMFNYLDEEGYDLGSMKNILPDYFDQIGAFQVPMPVGLRKMMGLPTDTPLFINPKLPFLALNLFPPVWDLFEDDGGSMAQRFGRVFSPLVGMIGPFAPLPIPGAKTMLEAWVNRSLGLNRPLDYQRGQSNDWRNAYSPAPGWVQYLPDGLRDFFGVFRMRTDAAGRETWWMTNTSKYVLEQVSTPFINNLGRAIPTGAETYADQKSRADLVSWISGVRLIPVDTLRLHRQWAYRLESMLEAHKGDVQANGGQLEPEDEMTLKYLRAQIQVLERAWDKQQEEIGATDNAND